MFSSAPVILIALYPKGWRSMRRKSYSLHSWDAVSRHLFAEYLSLRLVTAAQKFKLYISYFKHHLIYSFEHALTFYARQIYILHNTSTLHLCTCKANVYFGSFYLPKLFMYCLIMLNIDCCCLYNCLWFKHNFTIMYVIKYWIFSIADIFNIGFWPRAFFGGDEPDPSLRYMRIVFFFF